MKRSIQRHVAGVVLILSAISFGACPSMDVTGDCRVDLADFAVFASQWLTEGSYMLHVNSSGTLGVSIASSTGHGGITNYTQTPTVGTVVTLTAPATVSDTTFTGWTGDVKSTDQTISFAMNADKTVTAKYVLTTTNMVWININDPGVPGHEGFTGQMSKYETTNAQYCEFLNSALASGDITTSGDYVLGANGSNIGTDYVGQLYYEGNGNGMTYDGATDGGAARINFNEGVFSVDSGFENHPVTYVTWYGAMAFCNYYIYRLPTEWEWQAVADYDGSYTWGCGTSINHNTANYMGSAHPDGTTDVGAFGLYGYGICDMSGNVWECTGSSGGGGTYVLCGGCWYDDGNFCNISRRDYCLPDFSVFGIGFRVCR